MRSITAITLFFLTVLSATASHATYTWTPLETGNYLYGIDGANIVGSYTDSSGTSHGTLYDGSTWNTLDHPGAIDTQLRGIDGANIVGHYSTNNGLNGHGFLYNVNSST